MSVFEFADSEDEQNRENDNIKHFLGTLKLLEWLLSLVLKNVLFQNARNEPAT